MPRPTAVLIAIVALPLVIVLTSLAPLARIADIAGLAEVTGLADIAGVVHHPPAARAAADADASPRLRSVVFSTYVAVPAKPGTFGQVDVTQGGARKWRGEGTADATGRLEFKPIIEGRRPVSDLLLFGGELITASLDDAPPVTSTMAALLVTVDPDADRVFGFGPPRDAVTVTLRPDPESTDVIVRRVPTDADRLWVLDLSGVRDVRPGAFGEVVHADAAGHETMIPFAAMAAEFIMGYQRVSFRGTNGDRVTYRVRKLDGTVTRPIGSTIGGYTPRTPPGVRESHGLTEILPGMIVTFTDVSPMPLVRRSIAMTVPDLALRFDAGAGVLRGSGPAGTSLTVEAVSPAGEVRRIKVTTDAGGAFVVGDATADGIGPGWKMALIYDAGNGLRVRAPFAIPQARIEVYTHRLGGVTVPGAAISATLRASDGTLKGRLKYAAAHPEDGSLRAEMEDLTGQDPVPMDPGDVLDLTMSGAGDRLSLTIPRLTARTDADAETVDGVALPGARVWVTAPVPSAEQPTIVATVADAQGRYRAEFKGKVDLEPPMIGDVLVEGTGGQLFATEWAAVQIWLYTWDAMGNAPSGRDATLTLRGADGRVESTARTRASMDERGEGWWSFDPVNVFGRSIRLRAGDTISGRVGDDDVSVTMPALWADVDVQRDVITGHSLPNTPIQIDAVAERIVVMSDARGDFRADVAGKGDLLYNHGLNITVPVGRHIMEAYIAGAGLTVDLGTAAVEGAIAPGLAVAVELRDGAGAVRARAAARTDDWGVFKTVLRDAAGAPAAIRPGDRVVALAPDAAVNREVILRVPELTIDLDPAANRITGRAEPGGHLSVGASSGGVSAGASGSAEPVIRPDGTWEAIFEVSEFGSPEPVTLTPGKYVGAEYWTTEGHVVSIDRRVPIVAAQHGGGNVCGYADRGTLVQAELVDDRGTVVASGSTSAGADQSYALVLRDPAGRPMVAEAGMTVRARLGEKSVELPLPPLFVEVDWAKLTAIGYGPPGRRFHVATPAGRCLDSFPADSGSTQTTDDGGRFAFDPSGGGSGDPRLHLTFQLPNGHRLYRQEARARADVWVDTDRVTGSAMPMTLVRATLTRAADGGFAAGAIALADSDGAFDLRLIDADDRPVVIRPGDRVEVGQANGADPEDGIEAIAVEPLTMAWGPGGIEGAATAGRDVALALTLRDGRTFDVTRRTGDDGRYGFDAALIPSRLGWGMGDVETVRASLAVGRGNRVVVEIRRDAGARAHLPWAGTGRE